MEQIYAVELLFETEPNIQSNILLPALRRACPDIELMGTPGEAGLLHFAHSAHLVHYDQGAVPAQLLLFTGERKDDRNKVSDAKRSEAVQQSWNLPDAAAGRRFPAA